MAEMTNSDEWSGKFQLEDNRDAPGLRLQDSIRPSGPHIAVLPFFDF